MRFFILALVHSSNSSNATEMDWTRLAMRNYRAVKQIFHWKPSGRR